MGGLVRTPSDSQPQGWSAAEKLLDAEVWLRTCPVIALNALFREEEVLPLLRRGRQTPNEFVPWHGSHPQSSAGHIACSGHY